jgi:serine/threonine-protein kinase
LAVSIIAGALHGLHAAHEAKSERGAPLGIVHRDVSPQNILVGTDGTPRVLDFGVAKAVSRTTSTRDGQMKGKVSYMSPEQLRGKGVDRRTDVFAAGIVLWESLTGRRLFDGDDPGEVLTKLLEAEIPPPSKVEPSVPAALDEIVMKALVRDPNGRWTSAREFAIALEHSGTIALPREVGEWVEVVGGETITKRAVQIAEIESVSSTGLRPVGEQTTQVAPLSGRHVSASQPAYPAQPVNAPPTSWPVNAQGDPITSPSQVSHVTGVSRPSVSSAPSAASLSSQLGSQSYAPSRGKGLHAALIGIAAALGLALVAMVVVLLGRQRLQSSSETTAPPPPTAEPTGSVAVEPPPPSPVEPPPVSIVELPIASAQKPDVPKPPRPTTQVQRPPKSSPKPAPPAEPNCDPPVFVDKHGVRRIKPGCG